MTDERLAAMPTYAALQQIRLQLVQVQQDVWKQWPPDPLLQKEVVFGRFAARNLEDADPEYADVLERVAYLYRRNSAPPPSPIA